MKNKTNKKCLICGSLKIYAKNLCRPHYQRQLKEKEIRICKIEGCNRKHHSLGLCEMHYNRQRKGIKDMRPGNLPKKWKKDDPRSRKNKNLKCIVTNCNNEYYAKKLCCNHYGLNERNGLPIPLKDFPKPICSVKDCYKISFGDHGFCKFHIIRHRNGTRLTRPKGIKGELNHNWKGGIFQYPNHHKLKKNRLIVLEKSGWVCEYCGNKADRVHHRDKTTYNHKIENLAPSCAKCNSQRMSNNRRYFLSNYGISLKNISKKTGMSTNEINYAYDNGGLEDILLFYNISANELKLETYVPDYQI